jgi:hypothetical protein
MMHHWQDAKHIPPATLYKNLPMSIVVAEPESGAPSSLMPVDASDVMIYYVMRHNLLGNGNIGFATLFDFLTEKIFSQHFMHLSLIKVFNVDSTE